MNTLLDSLCWINSAGFKATASPAFKRNSLFRLNFRVSLFYPRFHFHIDFYSKEEMGGH